MEEVDRANSGGAMRKRDIIEVAARDPLMENRDHGNVREVISKRQGLQIDPDANVGSDYDAMPAEEGGEDVPAPPEPVRLAIPNSVFRPARILVNPRCPTTYAGVSHTQLALDLFGSGDDAGGGGGVKKYVLDDWEGAPESFVCQEQQSVSNASVLLLCSLLVYQTNGWTESS
jgi:hypothetical protein